MSTETRNLLSRESSLKHTGCVLPMMGMPCDVPVPRNVIVNGGTA